MHVKQAFGIAVMTSLITFAGCGGGNPDTQNIGSTDLKSDIITGTAIDGYVSGATVCLDIDRSATCGAGEPSSITGANGRFSLDISAVNATDRLHAQILVTGGTDEGTQAPFEGILLAPLDQNLTGMVVTPLTTIIAAKVENNGEIEQVKLQVATALGLKPHELNEDPIAKNNIHLMEKALEYQKAFELLAVAISEDDELDEDIAKVAKALAPAFVGNQQSLTEILESFNTAELNITDEAVINRVTEAKQAILAIATRLQSEGVVTESEIKSQIRVMEKSAEKYKQAAKVKIKDETDELDEEDLNKADDELEQEHAGQEASSSSSSSNNGTSGASSSSSEVEDENEHESSSSTEKEEQTGSSSSQGGILPGRPGSGEANNGSDKKEEEHTNGSSSTGTLLPGMSAADNEDDENDDENDESSSSSASSVPLPGVA